jgi:hypothetical protein
MAVGTRSADHGTPLYPQKLALTLPRIGVLRIMFVRQNEWYQDGTFSVTSNLNCIVQLTLPNMKERKSEKFKSGSLVLYIVFV